MDGCWLSLQSFIFCDLSFKKAIMDTIDYSYFDFLKFCLGTTSVIPDISNINWAELLDFSRKQTIAGIYWQGIKRLENKKNMPSEDNVMEWLGEYQKIIRRNSIVDKALTKLSLLLNNNSIKFFVFKGQTVAQYYQVPESRTSGDVDFYIFKKDWDKAINILGKIIRIKNGHLYRHLDFDMEGVQFEMHYHTAVFASGSKQRYWDELIDSYFDDVLDHVEINGMSVPTLPPTLNAIYLFVHIYHHFLKEGIALRQFIDWMMFFEAKHDEIVVSELTAKLERLGSLCAFRAFGVILTEVLGMDTNFFPYALTDTDKRYVEKIMAIVLRYGNFGKYGRKEQQGGWKHSMEMGFRAFHHLTQFFWLSPSENILMLPKLLSRSIKKNIAVD